MASKVLRPLGLWTPKKLAKYGSAKIYELIHGYRAPNYCLMGGTLWVKHWKADGRCDDRGIVSVNEVTDVFVNFMVDQLQVETATWGDFKFHISGTNTAVDDQTDTEATITGATPTPVTGTQAEGASAFIYQSVGTIPYVSTLAIEAHGLINNSTKAGAVLMDHSQFTVINVVNTDSIEFTYELTCTAGG